MKQFVVATLVAVAVVMPQCKPGEIPFAYTDSNGKLTTGCIPQPPPTKDK